MILIAPAMYDAAAYTTKFGPNFTDIIRKPKSYERSDAWRILEKFTGKLLVIAGREDVVIPSEVIHRCYESAISSTRKLVLLDGIDHFVMSRLRSEEPDRLDSVLDMIMSALSKSHSDYLTRALCRVDPSNRHREVLPGVIANTMTAAINAGWTVRSGSGFLPEHSHFQKA
ncbi:hypothetical protein HED51_23865 [Ochrobactrum grignonense]|nr:hypothetical protein [Brucella grignonensis]